MSQPAARQGDMTRHGGPIIQGSSTVFIGSGGGVACSACASGIAEGNPVNPLLGAKVLASETDLSLPGPLPLHVTREYCSYQTPTPAPVGLLGPGWWLPCEPSLQTGGGQLMLHDGKGRSIRFDPLEPGEVAFSASENLWLVRGGLLQLQRAGHPQRLAAAYAALPLELRQDPGFILATASALGPWWVFGPCAGDACQLQQEGQDGQDSPLQGQRLRLLGQVDRFGHEHRLQYHRSGELKGQIDTILDGAGRCYQLQLQRVHPGQGAAHGWGADAGLRLVAIHLRSDPCFGGPLPQQPLVRYAYSQRGELTAVHGRDGQTMRCFSYDPQHPGRMVGLSHAGRPTSRYSYDAQGRVIGQHNPEGLDYRFDYGDCPDTGQPSTLVTDSLGRQRRYIFQGQGGLRRIASIIEADGSRHTYRHDSSGRLVERIDPLGRSTTLQRDTASGDVVGITDSAGRSTVLQYNLSGQPTASSAPAGNGEQARQQWHYDTLGRLRQHMDALGHSTRYHYPGDETPPAPAQGNPEPAATRPAAPPHLPIAITNAKGRRQHLQWDKRGLLLRQQDCSGRSTEYTYDGWGQLTAIRTEEGGRQAFAYDGASRLIASTDALDHTTRYTYTAAGDLQRIEHPGGHLELFEHDAWGRSTGYSYGTADQLLHQRYQRDQAGRLIELHNENNSIHRLRYDSQDRVIEETGFDASTRRWEYDAAGRILASGDALHLTRYHYDERTGALRQRSTIALGQGDGAPGTPAQEPVAEHFEYDSAGHLCGAHHSVWGGYRLATRFERDRMGRIVAETQQMHGPQDQLLWSHRSQRQLDESGHVTQTAVDGLPALQWLHYGPGHLHGLQLLEHSVLEIQRDGLHRETQRRCGAFTIERGYDSVSRLAQTRLAGGAAHVQAAGAIDQGPTLQQLNRSYRYDAQGQLCGTGTAQGAWTYGYDTAGRLVHAQGPDVEKRWQYDPAGNRIYAHQQQQDAQSNWAELVRQHLHDPDFNLLQSDRPGSAGGGQPCWPGNRILRDDSHEYRYDRAGNLRQKAAAQQTRHYDWDHANRLAGHRSLDARQAAAMAADMGQPGQPLASRNFYDVFGRRIARQTGGDAAALTFYGWDGDRLTLTQLPACGSQPVRRIHTIYEPDSFVPLLRVETGELARAPTLAELWEQDSEQPVDAQQRQMLDEVQQQLLQGPSAQTRQALAEFGLDADALREKLLAPLPDITSLHLYHCDHLGTPQALIRPTGQIDWQIELDPWGNTLKEYNPLDLYQPIRMQGQHLDEDSGLFYNRYRYYDPKLGRYISRDPIGLAGGINSFNYAESSPTRNFDPLGLMNCEQGWLNNVVDNYINTQKAADGMVDDVFDSIPDWMTSPATPFTTMLGGATAGSAGGRTLGQAAVRFWKESFLSRSGAGWIQPIRTAGLFTNAIRTSLVQGVAVSGAWSGGVLLGSMVSATAKSISCSCRE